ncbi:MAG: hypothetical protein KME45_19250 [Stenomitos rutilans HA7619-LM2]|nr:hypothetical protein [Stenomitos rutilans HA7619-LM2]
MAHYPRVAWARHTLREASYGQRCFEFYGGGLPHAMPLREAIATFQTSSQRSLAHLALQRFPGT